MTVRAPLLDLPAEHDVADVTRALDTSTDVRGGTFWEWEEPEIEWPSNWGPQPRPYDRETDE